MGFLGSIFCIAVCDRCVVNAENESTGILFLDNDSLKYCTDFGCSILVEISDGGSVPHDVWDGVLWGVGRELDGHRVFCAI